MTVAEIKAAQADAPDGVGQVPHGVPRDYNFAVDILQKNLTAGRADKRCGKGMLLSGRGRAAQGGKALPAARGAGGDAAGDRGIRRSRYEGE